MLIKKIGLFGGSFNPPHMGHLAVSLDCIKKLHLNELWWIITNHNPAKCDQLQYSLEQKMQIAKSIIQYNNKICLSDMDHISYFTIDIIEYIIKHNDHNNKYALIMGLDNYLSLNKWKDWQKIIMLLPVIVFNRPINKNYDINTLAKQYNQNISNNNKDIFNCKLPCMTFIPNIVSNLSSNKLIC